MTKPAKKLTNRQLAHENNLCIIEMDKQIATLKAEIHRLTKRKPLYRHWKGATYKLLCLARYEDTTLPVAVYQCLSTGQVWVRGARQFGEKFKLISAGGK